MAHSVSASHGLFTSAIEGLFDILRDIKTNYVRHRNIQITKKELHNLTDRELWDIGISRGEIHDIAVNSFPKVNAEENDNLKGWV